MLKINKLKAFNEAQNLQADDNENLDFHFRSNDSDGDSDDDDTDNNSDVDGNSNIPPLLSASPSGPNNKKNKKYKLQYSHKPTWGK